MTETSNPLDVSHLWAPYRSNTSRRRDILPYHEEYGELVINTELLAYLIRSYSVFEMTCAGLGHPGGSSSTTGPGMAGWNLIRTAWSRRASRSAAARWVRSRELQSEGLWLFERTDRIRTIEWCTHSWVTVSGFSFHLARIAQRRYGCGFVSGPCPELRGGFPLSSQVRDRRYHRRKVYVDGRERVVLIRSGSGKAILPKSAALRVIAEIGTSPFLEVTPYARRLGFLVCKTPGHRHGAVQDKGHYTLPSSIISRIESPARVWFD